MRKFTAKSLGGVERGLLTLCDAAIRVRLLDHELDALADLAVGQTFVDDDGDTWERVE